MVSNEVTIGINVDTTQANAQIMAVSGRVKEVVNEWFYARQTIIREIQTTVSQVSQAISLARQTISIVGETLDPFFSSLLTMVMSSVSTLLSIAAAMAATGVGIPASVAIGIIALGLNAVQTAKILKAQVEANRYTMASLRRIDRAVIQMSNYRSGF